VGLATTVAAVLIASSAPHAQQVVDRVLARVGEYAVTMTDLRAAVGFGLVETGAGAGDPLEQVIARRLALTEVFRRRPQEPEEGAIDAEAARLRANAGDQLSELMAATGVSADRLRGLARETLLIRAYLEDRFPLVPAGDADAEQYYRRNPGAFTRDGALLPFGDVADEARRAASIERRDGRMATWFEGLRRRIDVVIPVTPGRPAAPPVR
jgi:hypothetical protein